MQFDRWARNRGEDGNGPYLSPPSLSGCPSEANKQFEERAERGKTGWQIMRAVGAGALHSRWVVDRHQCSKFWSYGLVKIYDGLLLCPTRQQSALVMRK